MITACGALLASAQDLRELPPGKVVNQLSISGNACGPAALLNSLRSGTGAWRRVAERLPGDGDRGQLRYLIRVYGLRPSESLRGRPRWSRQGINVNDLTRMANEACAASFGLKWKSEVIGGRREDLEVAHRRISRSLARGLPPIVSVRRMVLRKVNGRLMWLPLEGHFVTVIAVSKKPPRDAGAFHVRYVDPWGGRMAEGRIRAEDESAALGVVADFPEASVGKSKVRPGEKTRLVAAAVLGNW